MASFTYTYTIPSDAYRPETFSLRVEDFVIVSTPALGGAIRTYEVPGTRMVATIGYGEQTTAERAEIAGWWSVAGLKRNRVRLFHMALQAPRGTYRGTGTITQAGAAGAESIEVGAGVNGTLKRGDPIGLADGMHLVTTDHPGGGGVVYFQPGLRYAIASGSPVTWDRPSAIFMCLVPPEIPFRGSGPHPPFSIQLVETW